MALNPKQIKYLRKAGHSLSPIVTVADRGLVETVFAAINEALELHELIKVKVRHPKPQRQQMCADICNKTGAAAIQQIGMILLIYRTAKIPKMTVPGLKRGA